MQQVITIAKDGTISGLQHKKGKGIDLRQFGHAEIERASEIEWNEVAQCWHVVPLSENVVRWMLGRSDTRATMKLSHWTRTVGTAAPEGSCPVPMMPRPAGNDCWLGFDDYEDAVKAEVAFLNALRRRGIY